MIKAGIGFKVGDFIAMLFRGIACILFGIVTAPKFAIVFLAFVPLMMFSMVMMITMIKKYTVEEFKAYGKAGQVAQEALGAVRTVVALGIHKKAVENYEKNLQVSERMAIKKGLTSGVFAATANGLFLFTFGVGIMYATYLVRVDCKNEGIGQVIPAFFCVVTSAFSIGQALGYLKDLAEAKGAAKKVYAILEEKSKIDVMDETANKKKLSKLNGEIEFENVYFSYPSRPDASILNGLNLSIPAGKTIALVGSRYL